MYRTTTLYLVLAFVSLSLGGCYLWAESDEYYGLKLEDDQEKALFVVDVSGSMEGNAEGKKPKGRLTTRATDEAITRGSKVTGELLPGRVGSMVNDKGEERAREETTKLGRVKRELMPMIRGLDENNSFNILLFGGDDDWKRQAVPANDQNRSQARMFVERLSSGGSTDALAALRRAFKENDVDVIFFLSDGQPTDASPNEILDEMQDTNRDRGVIIHTIGVGDDMDEVFLDRLAEQNSGEFVYF